MKIIKKINNNVAIGLDGNQNEVIVFGKGVGFPKTPYELSDLSKIDRTFYDVDERFYQLFSEIDLDLLKFVAEMVDVLKTKIKGNFDPNLAFILTDHLSFSLKRLKSGLSIGFPYSYEIETEFPIYNTLARWIVENVNKRMKVELETGEVTCIAMHLINSHEGSFSSQENIFERYTRIQNEVTSIIEDFFNMKIDKKSLDYYRFRYHLQYFVKRKNESKPITDSNSTLYQQMVENYPETYECVKVIEKYLENEFKTSCSKDELLYLMIHINRLYV